MKQSLTITQMIIVLNFIFYIFQYNDPSVYQFYISPLENFNIITYFTAAFSHLDIFHLFMNMLFLYYMGTILERLLGPKIYIGFYVFCILISGFITDIWSTAFVAGASGVLYAILISIIILAYKLPQRFVQVNLQSLLSLLALNLVISLVLTNVSLVGHLSGILAGVIFSSIYLNFIIKK